MRVCVSTKYMKSSLPQGPCMARCTTGLRPRSELSNPPFLCLHERLRGRETENKSVNVVINATLALHGILTSALHNGQSDLFWEKVRLLLCMAIDPCRWIGQGFGFLMNSFFVFSFFLLPLSSPHLFLSCIYLFFFCICYRLGNLHRVRTRGELSVFAGELNC